jgi:hypothetical protein
MNYSVEVICGEKLYLKLRDIHHNPSEAILRILDERFGLESKEPVTLPNFPKGIDSFSQLRLEDLIEKCGLNRDFERSEFGRLSPNIYCRQVNGRLMAKGYGAVSYDNVAQRFQFLPIPIPIPA